MASRDLLASTSAIERSQAADVLRAMLENIEHLPNYGDLNPRMQSAGNTIDSLRRVSHGFATDPTYDLAILVGALTHVIVDQQERIAALEEKASEPKSRRNTKRGREGAA